jgi:DNA invertase Pin-like site-specific DNA recombinase
MSQAKLRGDDMKRTAIYARVSTSDQHLENLILDLRKLAAQRGFL